MLQIGQLRFNISIFFVLMHLLVSVLGFKPCSLRYSSYTSRLNRTHEAHSVSHTINQNPNLFKMFIDIFKLFFMYFMYINRQRKYMYK